MSDALFGLLVTIGVVVILILKTKGAAIRKAAHPPEPREPAGPARTVLEWISVWALFAVITALVLAIMGPGLWGVFDLVVAVSDWFKTAEWKTRAIGDLISLSNLRSGDQLVD